MSRIVINNRCGIDDMNALIAVQKVIQSDERSDGPNGEQYCFVSSFTILDTEKTFYVYARKSKTGTHTFHLINQG